jgi:peptide/nickel transport system permease protein
VATAPALDESQTDALEHPGRAGREFIRATLAEREGRIGVALLGLMLLLIVIGPSVAPYSPYETAVGLPLQGPSSRHLLGTDDFGRDILSRVLCGGREIVIIPFLGTALAFIVGTVVGIVSAFRGGFVDTAVTRTVDVTLALPPLLIVLIVIAGAGGAASVQVAMIAIVFAPRIVRVTRGAAQAVVSNEYVEIARTRGESSLSIALREILPNITGTLTVEFAIRFTYAILFIATLNFLGVGAQPPSPNWGLMVADGREIMGIVPLAALAPAAAIALLSIALNLIADAGAHALAHEAGTGSELFQR